MLPSHYLRQGNSWMSQRAANALRRYLEAVDEEISDSMVPPSGGTVPWEVTITQNLVNLIADRRWSERVTLEQTLAKDGIGVDFVARDLQGGAEQKSKADILIRVTVDLQHFYVDKAILCQAKRSTGPKFGTLFEADGLNQAEEMLLQTPASFFLLYHPPYSEIWKGRAPVPEYRLAVGLQFLPATSVLGMHNRSPDSSLAIIGHFSSLPPFLVNDFFQCKVGHLFGEHGRYLMDSLWDEGQNPHRPRFQLHFRFFAHKW